MLGPWYLSSGCLLHARLSQYVNLVEALPCLSLLLLLVFLLLLLFHLLGTSLYFALFAPRLLPIDPLPAPILFLSRGKRLLFPGFLLRLISGLNRLNHHLCSTGLELWGGEVEVGELWGGGPSVRRGNDGTQSTELQRRGNTNHEM